MLQEVYVTFNEMKLEEESYCSYDSVILYDGSNDEATLLGEFCTDAFPVTSTGSSLFVVFQTDSSVNKGGFSLNWKFVGQGWLEWRM